MKQEFLYKQVKSIVLILILSLFTLVTKAQDTPSLFTTMNKVRDIPYGNNPDAGAYFMSGKVKLYYEIYGKGEPILMLHGGVYGYIDEFAPLIDKLSKNYQVICLATRGHGKSYIGNETFTYQQRAEDAYNLLQHLKIDSSIVLGFSDGAFTALKMAALYQNVVKKLIVMGVGDHPKDMQFKKWTYNSKDLLKEANERFTKLLPLMPEPERWDIGLEYGNHLYNDDYVSKETHSKIKCPVLLMNGQYDNLDNLVICYKAIQNAKLAIIPGCGHVVFLCNFQAVWLYIEEFLK